MAIMKATMPVTRRVWRITADAPSGEYVVIGDSRRPSQNSCEVHEAGWDESSYDLAHGLEVREIFPSTTADPWLMRLQNT